MRPTTSICTAPSSGSAPSACSPPPCVGASRARSAPWGPAPGAPTSDRQRVDALGGQPVQDGARAPPGMRTQRSTTRASAPAHLMGAPRRLARPVHQRRPSPRWRTCSHSCTVWRATPLRRATSTAVAPRARPALPHSAASPRPRLHEHDRPPSVPWTRTTTAKEEATAPWWTLRQARVSGRSRSHCRPRAGAASGKCQAGAGATDPS